ncbi:MAG: ABC transporter ATP-binding protein, partial [Anaerolineae bacterium]
MSDIHFEEEEFETEFNGRTVLRILAQAKPHWPMLAGFLFFITSVSVVDSYLTFLGKRLVDEAILGQDRVALTEILTLYGVMFVLLASGVFGFIYL